ncbi:MAG TPA: chlorite dismutase family protein [Gemmatimonadaceae bacterium]
MEGWYALHQIFSVVPESANDVSLPRVDSTQVVRILGEGEQGWSVIARLIGSKSDYLVVHFRPTLDGIGDAQNRLAALPMMRGLRIDYSFLSVTEAGLYHLTAKLAREAAERGGSVGDATYAADLASRSKAEIENPHVRRRLYPNVPDDMPYVCFYPMSKRRNPDQNWYGLELDERSRLMQTHGQTGRRYAGRVVQVISGAIGFDAWEWGVTLFARDPLDFKKLVTDMRFDEVSAKYAEFGEFYVGKLMTETAAPSAS